MSSEATIERDGGPDFDFDAFRNVVVAICATEGNSHHIRTSKVHRVCRSATIDVGNASASGTDAARAIRIGNADFAVGTRRAHTAAAIDVGLRAILRPIHAGWCGAGHHVVAEAARAVAIDVTRITVHAIGARRTSAIGIRLIAILDTVGAGRHDARHHGIAITARAVSVDVTRIAVHAIGACRTTAIGIGLVAILDHIHAGWGRADHRIANAARTVAINGAGVAVHAIAAGETTTIGIRFAAIGKSIHTRWRGAYIRHGIAESALTIAIDTTTLTIGAIVRAGAAAIDVGFRAIFLRIGAAWRGACSAHTNLAQTIRVHPAHFAISAAAARSAAIDIGFRAVFRHIAALCGLTNVCLTNVRCAISADVAFDARASAVTNLAPAFSASRSYRRRGISRHSIAARIFRTSLVVAHRIHIVVLRNNRAITVANHDLTITGRLRHDRCPCANVCFDARSLETIHGNAFIGWRRAVRSHCTHRTASSSAHSTSAHSAATHSSASTAARRGRRGRRGRRRAIASTCADFAAIDASYEFTTGRNSKESNDAKHRACQDSGVKCLHGFLDPLRNVLPESRVHHVKVARRPSDSRASTTRSPLNLEGFLLMSTKLLCTRTTLPYLIVTRSVRHLAQ